MVKGQKRPPPPKSQGTDGDGTRTEEGSVHYFQIRDFEKSLQKTLQRGGEGKRAWKTTKAILGNLTEGDPFKGLVTPTIHGESRIQHSVKYDLGDGWRLVTWQNARTCGFLFIGNHDDVDHWLENNQGQRFAVGDRRATLVPGVGALISAGEPVSSSGQRLFELLPAELADHVFAGIPRSVARELEVLDTLTGSAELTAIAESIEDAERASLTLSVFNQLIHGNVDGAISIARLHMGEIRGFDELEDEELLEAEDGAEVRHLRIGSPEYEKWLLDIEKRSGWYEWFLFLHPEQEEVVSTDYPGSAQLSGVSGSGKTCVAVRRALRMAEDPDSKVLLVTLNRSLAGLLRQLVDAAATDSRLRERIEVISFFQLGKRLLVQFEPENERIYQDVTWQLKEHVDEIFREYYRQWLNCFDARVLVPLHQSINARGVSGEAYLREEFDWIRSAVGPAHRSDYLELPRRGRRFPLAGDMRQDILDGLSGWETKMRQVGVVDYLGLTSALSHHIDRIEPEFSHIIIDEAQDLGTTELRIIRKLVPEGPNDLFLCGDVAQTILPKHRSLTDAGIHSPTRARIVQNYRNSREILAAAYDLLRHNLHEDMLDSEDLEILDPKFANFSGQVPMALLCDSLEDEIAYARSFADTRLKQGVKTVCIGFAGFSTRDIAGFAKKCGVTALDGAYDPSTDRLVFSDLEQTKGYEFETLIIIQCTADVLPPKDEPEEEAHRAACKLYVAMTRAKHELILSFHGEASPWVTVVNESIDTDLWSAFEEMKPEFKVGVPDILPEIHPDSGVSHALKLQGSQFLYTKHAIGLSVEAQQKLEVLVDGQGLMKGDSGKSLRWADVGSLITDLTNGKKHDRSIGSVIAEEFRELGRRLGS
jgi:hypothetical protein